MDFITVPNLPAAPVVLIMADGRISKSVEDSISGIGITVIKTRMFKGIHEAVAFHPDMVVHHIGGNRLVYAPGTDSDVIDCLRRNGFEPVMGETELTGRYPGDIAYNVARVGCYALHNTRYTDPVIKSELERAGVEFLNVRQGYTKCAVSVIDEKSIITSDAGIAKAAEARGIEALVIEPDENILLPGMSGGFIGGCTGLLGKNMWAVTGDIQYLKSYLKITDFLNKRQVDIILLSNDKPVDIGTVIPLKTE